MHKCPQSKNGYYAPPKIATTSSGSELLDLRLLCLEEEHKLMHQWCPFQLQF